MSGYVCEPPELDDKLFQEVEDWTCPECGEEWALGWEESWDSAWRLWEKA